MNLEAEKKHVLNLFGQITKGLLFLDYDDDYDDGDNDDENDNDDYDD